MDDKSTQDTSTKDPSLKETSSKDSTTNDGALLPSLAPIDIGAQAPREIHVRAQYYEGQIDLKLFRARYPHYPVLASNPLIVETEQHHYVILTRFGAVVFWNCTEQNIQDLQAELRALPGAFERNDAVQDELTVYLGREYDHVTFNDVWLRDLTLEKIKIISLVLGQSVALDRFEQEVGQALNRANPVLSSLRQRGVLRARECDVLKTVGFALEVRAAVLANLTLFDDPPETWESETLAHLDNQLYDQFDLEERLSAVNQKLGFLMDINQTVLTLLANRKSQRLEWIIIILIVVELVMAILGKLR